MATITVKAKKLLTYDEGGNDFIPALDNAYVVEVERIGWEENEVLITCHDANGDELTVRCPKNMPITIDRK